MNKLDIRITGELCVADFDVRKIATHPDIKRTTHRVHTAWGMTEKVMAHLTRTIKRPPIKRPDGTWESQPSITVPVLADVVTGTLYDPITGESSSPSLCLELQS